MNSPLDESGDQEDDLTMTYTPITKAEWDEIERIAADGPDRVTITTTPDVHAATEALLVAVARWYETEAAFTVQYGGEHVERLKWQYRQYRDALDEAGTF